MKERAYNRNAATAYAAEWAFSRNPKYGNFDGIGGDCTNFISQCIFAGSKIMNYTKDTGWYYINMNRRAPAWSSVEYLHKFLTGNKSVGPYGQILPLEQAHLGDIVQLSFGGGVYGHSLLIVKIDNPDLSGIKIATHTYDSYERALSTYSYEKYRLIHINGVKIW